eukprot:9476650-Alexandrium_andersonii.AAC.1
MPTRARGRLRPPRLQLHTYGPSRRVHSQNVEGRGKLVASRRLPFQPAQEWVGHPHGNRHVVEG